MAAERFRPSPPRHKPTRREAIWAAMNSAFFLWMMSSLVLGGLTFVYSRWDSNRTAEQRAADNRRRLRAEISSRMQQLSLLDDMMTSHAKPVNMSYADGSAPFVGIYVHKEDFANVVAATGKPHDGTVHGVFPEYENRELLALLYDPDLLTRDDEVDIRLVRTDLSLWKAEAERIMHGYKVSFLPATQPTDVYFDAKYEVMLFHVASLRYRWPTFLD